MLRRLFVLAVLAGGFVVAQPQSAMAGCTTDLIDCYYAAANEDSFWRRWAMGIDCELDYVECVRIKIMGF